MARAIQKIRLGTQEDILYQSLSKADGRKGLGTREVFAAG